MHKYRADGALGSSWHSYVHENGSVAPPIQEDETALVLFVFAQYYHMNPSPRLLREFYHTMVTPMANFMASYIDNVSGLPKPSYNLWEELYETTTYTTATVYAALLAAADLAEIAEDPDSAVRWRAAADDIASAAHKYLYNTERNMFYRGIKVENGHVEGDGVIDLSSLFGAFMFGLFPVEGEQMKESVATIEELFSRNGSIKGLPRYENDNYYRVDPQSPGNLWVITALWIAQYYTEIGEATKTREILDWVMNIAGTTGILPEQLGPHDERWVSVAPLTWSHAEFMATLLDTITEKQQ